MPIKQRAESWRTTCRTTLLYTCSLLRSRARTEVKRSGRSGDPEERDTSSPRQFFRDAKRCWIQRVLCHTHPSPKKGTFKNSKITPCLSVSVSPSCWSTLADNCAPSGTLDVQPMVMVLMHTATARSPAPSPSSLSLLSFAGPRNGTTPRTKKRASFRPNTMHADPLIGAAREQSREVAVPDKRQSRVVFQTTKHRASLVRFSLCLGRASNDPVRRPPSPYSTCQKIRFHGGGGGPDLWIICDHVRTYPTPIY